MILMEDGVSASTKMADANHSYMGLLGALLINISASQGAVQPIKEICYICSTISVRVSYESHKDCV